LGFDECATENRRRSIATLPSAALQVGMCVRWFARQCRVLDPGAAPRWVQCG
jgi:hypothetical protein